MHRSTLHRTAAAPAALLLAVCGMAASAAPVRAQLPDTLRADTVYRVQGVVVRGQREVTTAGGASVVAVVPDSLPIGPLPTVEQALRELPFVLVRQNSRGMAEISVRGSDSRQVAVLLDGIPLTLAWDHRTDPSVIPLMGAENLTVARGLPSMLSGPNVLGGVVEVDIGRARQRRALEADIRFTAGLDDAGYRAAGVSGLGVLDADPASRLVFRAGAGARSRDGVALPGGVADGGGSDDLRTNSDLEEVNAFGALRWEGERGRWVSLSASGFHADRGVPPELHVAEPRLWRYPDQWRVVSALTAGTGQRATPWGEGDLEASVGFSAGEQRIDAFRTLEYGEVVDTEAGAGRTLTLRLLGDHTVGNRGELRGAATYTDVNHAETLSGTERNEYRQRLWSLGSELAWRLPKSSRVSVGAALDGADTPETGGRPEQPALRAWGGRVGFSTLALRPDLQLHGSVSTRARFPSLRELYSGALGRFEPNPDLAPERLLAAEAGATLKRPGLELQATLFRHQLTDAVVRTTTSDGSYRRVNRDEINSAGVELLAAKAVGEVRILADLMLQDVTVQDPAAGADGAARAEHMPELQAGVDIDAALPLALRLIAGLDHTGAQYCVHPDRGTDVRLDASTRLDLALRRSFELGRGFWQALHATVGLDNVTDAAAFDQCGMPQPGRTLRMGIEVF